MMMYTCAVEGCDTKQARTFTKDSYNHGVVLLRCEGCNNLHLIADNLGWFESDGQYKGNNTNIPIEDYDELNDEKYTALKCFFWNRIIRIII